MEFTTSRRIQRCSLAVFMIALSWFNLSAPISALLSGGIQRTLDGEAVSRRSKPALRSRDTNRTEEVSMHGNFVNAFNQQKANNEGSYKLYNTPDSPDWPTDAMWREELAELLSPKAELFNHIHAQYEQFCDSNERGYSFYEEHEGVCTVFGDCHYQFCNRDGMKTPAVSPYTVKVITPEDISVAVSFANKYNIQVSVKLTGHNFAGQSTTKDSLNIWIIHLETRGDIIDNFQDTCGKNTSAVIGIGGGALNNDVFYDIQENYHILSGDTHSVGFAGWLLGGGLSHTARTYGVGADHVLGFDVVLANGKEVAVDECTNPDLFWALRGGGGGFGVVTHTYYRLLPVSRVVRVNFAIMDGSKKDLRAFLEYWAKITPTLDKRVAGGYFWLGGFEAYVMGTIEDANSLLLNGLRNFAETKLSGFYHIKTKESENWYNILGGFGAHDEERQYSQLQKYGHGPKASSRIIPEAMIVEQTEEIVDFFLEVGLHHDFGGYLLGGAVNEVDGQATSVHPALRTSLWMIITTDRVAAQKFREKFNNTVAGSSFNHHSPEEPDWRVGLWGESHYARLLAVKEKYDPDFRFNCWHCVGYQGPEFSVKDIRGLVDE